MLEKEEELMETCGYDFSILVRRLTWLMCALKIILAILTKFLIVE